MSTTYDRVPILSALTIETQRYRGAERQRDRETERNRDTGTQHSPAEK